MMTTYMAPIVVGVDGSAESLAAADWAAQEAVAQGCPLRVCHVVAYGPPFDLRVPHWDDELMVHGLAVAGRAADRVRATAENVEVQQAVNAGSASAELLAQAIWARLLVVGCRGVGAVQGLLLGSVSSQVAAHAPGPVVVVRGDRPWGSDAAPVTVGVDESGSEPALEFAFDYAFRHRRPVAAVYAYRLAPASPWVAPGLESVWRSQQRRCTDVLADLVRPWAEKYPEVHVDHLALDARPAAALTEESLRSELVVVGSRGHGGFAGLMLGSVSQQVLRHARCPVAVVRS